MAGSTLGGAVAEWPLAARAQESGVMRRIGVLDGGNAGSQAQRTSLRERLAKLGGSKVAIFRSAIAPAQTTKTDFAVMQPSK
jgi:hypothetical protein